MADITDTIGTTARDFSTQVLWEASWGVHSGDNLTGEMYPDSDFDEAPVFNDPTPTSVLLTTATDMWHKGVEDAGVRVLMSGNKQCYVIDRNDVTIENIEIDYARAHTAGVATGCVEVTSTTSDVLLNKIMLHGVQQTAGEAGGLVGVYANGNNNRVMNSWIYDFEMSRNAYVRGLMLNGIVTKNQEILNCVVANIINLGTNSSADAYGIYVTFNVANKILTNNICMGIVKTHIDAEALDFMARGSSTVTYCASEDDTSDDQGGAGNLINKTFANQFVGVTPGSENLALKTGADVIGAGTNLGTTPAGIEETINDLTRSAPWDMGAWKYVASETILDFDHSVGRGMHRGLAVGIN